MKKLAFIVLLCSGVVVAAQTISYFNTGLLRQPSAALDRAYLGITNGGGGIGPQGPVGPQGPIGPVGPAGTSGTNGVNGVNGTNGAPGLNGTNGLPGLNGTNGLPGLNGTNGAPGLNGTNGLPGLNGTNGLPGLNGTNGAPGLNGTNGLPGLNGTNGLPGLNGTNGLPGLNGTNGATGATGPPGPSGTNSAVGISSTQTVATATGYLTNTYSLGILVSAITNSLLACPTNDIADWWKFDDGSGTNVLDSIGTNSGVMVNVQTWTNGVMGGALFFDGGSNQVTLPATTFIHSGSQFTVTFWARVVDFVANKYQHILCLKSDIGVPFEFSLSNQANYNGFLFGGSSGIVQGHDNTPIQTITNGWHFYALTYNGGTPTLMSSYATYVDGNQTIPVPAGAFSGLANTSSFGIPPAGGSNNKFYGALDDARFYNRALIPAEIAKLYGWGFGCQ